MTTRISKLASASTLSGIELVEISQLSASVTITGTTISADASDNSYNDSANGFVTAGFTTGKSVNVSGFTGNVANNIVSGVVTSVAAGKIIIGGTDGDVIVTDAAGESVTIKQWDSKRSTAQAVADLSGVAAGREGLTADRTYYVRTDGSNSNTGLANTSGGAFLTIQKAIDVAAAELDLNGWSVYVNVADGTYTGNVSMKQLTGGYLLYIIGNSTTPTNVVVSTTGTCFTNGISGMKMTVKYLKATASAGNLFMTSVAGATMSLWGVDCGSATGNHQISAQNGLIYLDANYTISGGATYHYSASTFGEIYSNGKTCTISGTPTFTEFCDASSMGLIYGSSNTWSGGVNAATKRYGATGNSLINTFGSGASYYPGGVAGTTATGGQYL